MAALVGLVCLTMLSFAPVQPPQQELAPALIGGYATWYDDGPGDYAAAGPALRSALGRHWRGAFVEVRHGNRTVMVKVRDWCACGKRHGRATLLDLSPGAFAKLAPLSRGVIDVSIELKVRRVPDPPATDTE